MRSTKIIKICSSSLCTCLHHMVILRTQNKITDFLMTLAWASPFKQIHSQSGETWETFSRSCYAPLSPHRLKSPAL